MAVFRMSIYYFIEVLNPNIMIFIIIFDLKQITSFKTNFIRNEKRVNRLIIIYTENMKFDIIHIFIFWKVF